ncbi:cell division protein FtsZ [Saprospiraceae bacterium]|nr:cell division protein FtsZ [Saprospiraceae bacterium]
MEFEERKSTIIKVIGVGGGGSNAVAYMFNQGIVGVDFAVCNTDNQSLDSSPVGVRIQLGPNLTEGMGAGSVPEVGKQSCIESIDDVRKFLDTGTKMLFITAGMGGGTGTGAAPIIAKAAKEMGILTVAIVTLPFKFEGLRRQNQAIQGLEDLKKSVDSILVISNDRLRVMHGNLTLKNAFSKADDVLTTAARGIAEIITLPGYINVDFKDVNTVMKNSGVSIMGYAEAGGPDRARIAVEDALNSPLLEDNDIRGAQHILLNISSGVNEVTMDEIGEITDYIQEEAGYGTHLIWGNCTDESLEDKISITIIATGFEECASRTNQAEPQVTKIHIDEVFDVPCPEDKIDEENTAIPANVIDLDPRTSEIDPYVSTQNKGSQSRPAERQRRGARPAPKNVERRMSSVPLDNPRTIAEMEDIPAYKRREIQLDDVDREEQKANSKLSINFDDKDGPVIESNNSYFHNNVD